MLNFECMILYVGTIVDYNSLYWDKSFIKHLTFSIYFFVI